MICRSLNPFLDFPFRSLRGRPEVEAAAAAADVAAAAADVAAAAAEMGINILVNPLRSKLNHWGNAHLGELSWGNKSKISTWGNRSETPFRNRSETSVGNRSETSLGNKSETLWNKPEICHLKYLKIGLRYLE